MTQTLPETAPLFPTTPGAANPKAVALLLKRARRPGTPGAAEGNALLRGHEHDPQAQQGRGQPGRGRLPPAPPSARLPGRGQWSGGRHAPVRARPGHRPQVIERLVRLGPDHASVAATVCLTDEEFAALRTHCPRSIVLDSIETLPVKYGWLRELLPEQVNGVLTVFQEVAPLKPFDHIAANGQRFVSEARNWEAMNACGLTTPALAVEAAAALSWPRRGSIRRAFGGTGWPPSNGSWSGTACGVLAHARPARHSPGDAGRPPSGPARLGAPGG